MRFRALRGAAVAGVGFAGCASSNGILPAGRSQSEAPWQCGNLAKKELEAVAIESKRTIEIEEFVPKTQIDELYIRDPLYIAPDGKPASRLSLSSAKPSARRAWLPSAKLCSHPVSTSSRWKHVKKLGITLRYPYEVRKQSDYFDEIKDENVPKDMLDLALHIVDTKRGGFEPGNFEDQYEDALRELIEKKAKGEKSNGEAACRSNVVNLMDALRASVETEGRGAPRKGRRAHAAPSKKKPTLAR